MYNSKKKKDDIGSSLLQTVELNSPFIVEVLRIKAKTLSLED